MKNLVSRLQDNAQKYTALTALAGGLALGTGCTTTAVYNKDTLRENYQEINHPNNRSFNPQVRSVGYQPIGQDDLETMLPRDYEGNDLTYKALFPNNDRSKPTGITGVVGSSTQNGQYLITGINTRIDPRVRRAGIADDTSFDIYYAFVDKNEYHDLVGRDENVPLVFVNHYDGSPKKHVGTSALEGLTFTLASGGNVGGGALWSGVSLATKLGLDALSRESLEETTMGYSRMQFSQNVNKETQSQHNLDSLVKYFGPHIL
ncbi:MAG: hypothetical protein ACMXYA_00005, partial [Candidatus Woesearchaeota archaeon]